MIFKRSLLFFLLALASYVLTAFAFNRIYIEQTRLSVWLTPYIQKKCGQEGRMMQDYEPAKNYDVLLLGSSHAYRGYDPRVFHARGFAMFNTGTSSQNTLCTFVLQRHWIHTNGVPLLILDIYDRTFETEGIEGVNRLIQNSASHAVAQDLMFRFPDVRTFNTYTSRLLSSARCEDLPEEYISDGYCSQPDTARVFTGSSQVNCYPRSKYVYYFDELMTALEHSGSNYVLVSHPMPRSANTLAYHGSFRKKILPIVAKHGAAYFDLTLDARFDTCCHHSDYYHLNQAGVELFNHILIDTLVATGYLVQP